MTQRVKTVRKTVSPRTGGGIDLEGALIGGGSALNKFTLVFTPFEVPSGGASIPNTSVGSRGTGFSENQQNNNASHVTIAFSLENAAYSSATSDENKGSQVLLKTLVGPFSREDSGLYVIYQTYSGSGASKKTPAKEYHAMISSTELSVQKVVQNLAVLEGDARIRLNLSKKLAQDYSQVRVLFRRCPSAKSQRVSLEYFLEALKDYNREFRKNLLDASVSDDIFSTAIDDDGDGEFDMPTPFFEMFSSYAENANASNLLLIPTIPDMKDERFVSAVEHSLRGLFSVNVSRDEIGVLGEFFLDTNDAEAVDNWITENLTSWEDVYAHIFSLLESTVGVKDDDERITEHLVSLLQNYFSHIYSEYNQRFTPDSGIPPRDRNAHHTLPEFEIFQYLSPVNVSRIDAKILGKQASLMASQTEHIIEIPSAAVRRHSGVYAFQGLLSDRWETLMVYNLVVIPRDNTGIYYKDQSVHKYVTLKDVPSLAASEVQKTCLPIMMHIPQRGDGELSEESPEESICYIMNRNANGSTTESALSRSFSEPDTAIVTPESDLSVSFRKSVTLPLKTQSSGAYVFGYSNVSVVGTDPPPLHMQLLSKSSATPDQLKKNLYSTLPIGASIRTMRDRDVSLAVIPSPLPRSLRGGGKNGLRIQVVAKKNNGDFEETSNNGLVYSFEIEARAFETYGTVTPLFLTRPVQVRRMLVYVLDGAVVQNQRASYLGIRSGGVPPATEGVHSKLVPVLGEDAPSTGAEKDTFSCLFDIVWDSGSVRPLQREGRGTGHYTLFLDSGGKSYVRDLTSFEDLFKVENLPGRESTRRVYRRGLTLRVSFNFNKDGADSNSTPTKSWSKVLRILGPRKEYIIHNIPKEIEELPPKPADINKAETIRSYYETNAAASAEVDPIPHAFSEIKKHADILIAFIENTLRPYIKTSQKTVDLWYDAVFKGPNSGALSTPTMEINTQNLRVFYARLDDQALLFRNGFAEVSLGATRGATLSKVDRATALSKIDKDFSEYLLKLNDIDRKYQKSITEMPPGIAPPHPQYDRSSQSFFELKTAAEKATTLLRTEIVKRLKQTKERLTSIGTNYPAPGYDIGPIEAIYNPIEQEIEALLANTDPNTAPEYSDLLRRHNLLGDIGKFLQQWSRYAINTKRFLTDVESKKRAIATYQTDLNAEYLPLLEGSDVVERLSRSDPQIQANITLAENSVSDAIVTQKREEFDAELLAAFSASPGDEAKSRQINNSSKRAYADIISTYTNLATLKKSYNDALLRVYNSEKAATSLTAAEHERATEELGAKMSLLKTAIENTGVHNPAEVLALERDKDRSIVEFRQRLATFKALINTPGNVPLRAVSQALGEITTARQNVTDIAAQYEALSTRVVDAANIAALELQQERAEIRNKIRALTDVLIPEIDAFATQASNSLLVRDGEYRLLEPITGVKADFRIHSESLKRQIDSMNALNPLVTSISKGMEFPAGSLPRTPAIPPANSISAILAKDANNTINLAEAQEASRWLEAAIVVLQKEVNALKQETTTTVDQISTLVDDLTVEATKIKNAHVALMQKVSDMKTRVSRSRVRLEASRSDMQKLYEDVEFESTFNDGMHGKPAPGSVLSNHFEEFSKSYKRYIDALQYVEALDNTTPFKFKAKGGTQPSDDEKTQISTFAASVKEAQTTVPIPPFDSDPMIARDVLYSTALDFAEIKTGQAEALDLLGEETTIKNALDGIKEEIAKLDAALSAASLAALAAAKAAKKAAKAKPAPKVIPPKTGPAKVTVSRPRPPSVSTPTKAVGGEVEPSPEEELFEEYLSLLDHPFLHTKPMLISSIALLVVEPPTEEITTHEGSLITLDARKYVPRDVLSKNYTFKWDTPRGRSVGGQSFEGKDRITFRAASDGLDNGTYTFNVIENRAPPPIGSPSKIGLEYSVRQKTFLQPYEEVYTFPPDHGLLWDKIYFLAKTGANDDDYDESALGEGQLLADDKVLLSVVFNVVTQPIISANDQEAAFSEVLKRRNDFPRSVYLAKQIHYGGYPYAESRMSGEDIAAAQISDHDIMRAFTRYSKMAEEIIETILWDMYERDNDQDHTLAPALPKTTQGIIADVVNHLSADEDPRYDPETGSKDKSKEVDVLYRRTADMVRGYFGYTTDVDDPAWKPNDVLASEVSEDGLEYILLREIGINILMPVLVRDHLDWGYTHGRNTVPKWVDTTFFKYIETRPQLREEAKNRKLQLAEMAFTDTLRLLNSYGSDRRMSLSDAVRLLKSKNLDNQANYLPDYLGQVRGTQIEPHAVRHISKDSFVAFLRQQRVFSTSKTPTSGRVNIQEVNKLYDETLQPSDTSRFLIGAEIDHSANVEDFLESKNLEDLIVFLPSLYQTPSRTPSVGSELFISEETFYDFLDSEKIGKRDLSDSEIEQAFARDPRLQPDSVDRMVRDVMGSRFQRFVRDLQSESYTPLSHRRLGRPRTAESNRRNAQLARDNMREFGFMDNNIAEILDAQFDPDEYRATVSLLDLVNDLREFVNSMQEMDDEKRLFYKQFFVVRTLEPAPHHQPHLIGSGTHFDKHKASSSMIPLTPSSAPPEETRPTSASPLQKFISTTLSNSSIPVIRDRFSKMILREPLGKAPPNCFIVPITAQICVPEKPGLVKELLSLISPGNTVLDPEAKASIARTLVSESSKLSLDTKTTKNLEKYARSLEPLMDTSPKYVPGYHALSAIYQNVSPDDEPELQSIVTSIVTRMETSIKETTTKVFNDARTIRTTFESSVSKEEVGDTDPDTLPTLVKDSIRKVNDAYQEYRKHLDDSTSLEEFSEEFTKTLGKTAYKSSLLHKKYLSTVNSNVERYRSQVKELNKAVWRSLGIPGLKFSTQGIQEFYGTLEQEIIRTNGVQSSFSQEKDRVRTAADTLSDISRELASILPVNDPTISDEMKTIISSDSPAVEKLKAYKNLSPEQVRELRTRISDLNSRYRTVKAKSSGIDLGATLVRPSPDTKSILDGAYVQGINDTLDASGIGAYTEAVRLSDDFFYKLLRARMEKLREQLASVFDGYVRDTLKSDFFEWGSFPTVFYTEEFPRNLTHIFTDGNKIDIGEAWALFVAFFEQFHWVNIYVQTPFDSARVFQALSRGDPTSVKWDTVQSISNKLLAFYTTKTKRIRKHLADYSKDTSKDFVSDELLQELAAVDSSVPRDLLEIIAQNTKELLRLFQLQGDSASREAANIGWEHFPLIEDKQITYSDPRELVSKLIQLGLFYISAGFALGTIDDLSKIYNDGVVDAMKDIVLPVIDTHSKIFSSVVKILS